MCKFSFDHGVATGSRTPVSAMARRRTDRCATATWHGLEPRASTVEAWRSGLMSYCRMVVRRPSGGRTRSSGSRVQWSTCLSLTGVVTGHPAGRAFPPNRTETPRASTVCAAAYARKAWSGPPVPGGACLWTRADSNRRPPVCRTGALPLRHKPICVRTPRVERGVSCSENRRVAVSLGPVAPARDVEATRRVSTDVPSIGPSDIYMPSTVELTMSNSPKRIQGTHGRQDSNLQPSVLETGALYR